MINNTIKYTYLKIITDTCTVGLILLFIVILNQDIKAQDLVLQNMNISSAESFSASNSITVGPNFIITSTGDATLSSPLIDLNPGFLIMKGGKLKIISSENAVGVKTENEVITDDFILHQNYPNPFNPSTIIQFSLPKQSFVTLRIYDVLGKEINVLLNDELQPGKYKVNFDAEYLSSGIYFYKLNSKEFNQVRKMILVR